jgi:polysaccharide biosynthesis/export protein
MLPKFSSLLVFAGFLSLEFCLAPLSPALGQQQQQQPFNVRIDQSGNRLAPGDKVRLTVLGFPELSGEQTVLTDGTIQLPLAGDIALQGLSPGEAKDRLVEVLKPYVRRPQVGLALVNRRTPRISVTGEVNQPGPRQLTKQAANQDQNNQSPQGAQENPTVSSSLLLAGGVTPNADLRNVIIRRTGANRDPKPILTATGEAAASTVASAEAPKKEIKVNLWKAIREGNLKDDPQIFDGDEIVVPAAKLDASDQLALLGSTVAPGKINIQVAGQVQRPGAVVLAPNSDVTTAIAAAGGPTDKANTSAVTLIRMAPDGKVERQNYAFGQASAPVRNGDVILVDKSGTSNTLDLLSAFSSPLQFLFRGF